MTDLPPVAFEHRMVRLSWPGRDESLPPARSLLGPSPRSFATTDGRSVLLHGDNLRGLESLLVDFAGRVTLAYLDPPFFTGRMHEVVSRSAPRSGPLTARPKRFAFDDRWADRAAYLEALGERLVRVHLLLAPHGSVVVHVDSKMSHYVKVLGDEIFGDDAFASEIVWRYRRWPSKTPNFQRVHDVLLRWRKDPRCPPRFRQLYEPLAPSTVATWGATKQQAVFESDGRRVRSSSTVEPTPGVPMGDVWDIGIIAPISRERTGYPAQKPELLLERLVQALSDEGDIVLDPYAGSGTTLVVAARMGRAFLGIDESDVAMDIALRRLEGSGVSIAARRSDSRRT